MDIRNYRYDYELLEAGEPQPCAFALAVTPDVASGILYGLEQTVAVQNPTCVEISTVYTDFDGIPGAVRGG